MGPSNPFRWAMALPPSYQRIHKLKLKETELKRLRKRCQLEDTEETGEVDPKGMEGIFSSSDEQTVELDVQPLTANIFVFSKLVWLLVCFSFFLMLLCRLCVGQADALLSLQHVFGQEIGGISSWICFSFRKKCIQGVVETQSCTWESGCL